MKGPLLYFALLGLSLALFYFAPGIDLEASRLVYTPSAGFWLSHFPLFLVLHRAIPWLARGLALFAAFAGAWLFLLKRPLFGLDRKRLLFLVVAFALGPGLLVNTVFKDHWGRARPYQIEAFGGAKTFTPAALPSRECPTNCSFVSGDAALAFGFVAFAFLLPPGRRRRRGEAAALAFGGLVGLARIAEGAHFLSDVVDAGLLVYGSSWASYRVIVVRDALATPPLLRLYRALGSLLGRGFRTVRDEPVARFFFFFFATAVFVVVSIADFDRPVALFFHHEGTGIHSLFDLITRFGLGGPYLLAFAFAFVALHWGGALPRLKPFAATMRASSAVPAYLFTVVTVSGLAVDLMKVIFGRTRPTLFFSSHLYAFTWFATRADHWSFPSGHTVTVVALAAALARLWPRHLLFYVCLAALVAGSRLVVGAHFLSDIAAGAFVGVVSVHAVTLFFTRSGIDLDAAKLGIAPEAPPRVCRLLVRRGARQPRPQDH